MHQSDEVDILRWPAERNRVEQLRRSGRPRLLLVDDNWPPPVSSDPLEDWIRLPADQADVSARIEGLLRRLGLRSEIRPDLDEHGVFEFRNTRVALPPIEARLTRALLDRFGTVVTRTELLRAGWPGESPADNALDVRMHRLRRRLEPLGLSVRTIRARGHLLEIKAKGSVQESEAQA